MALARPHPDPRRRRRWLLLVAPLTVLMGVRGVMVGSSASPQPAESGPWAAGRSVPIAVDRGRALIRWPTPAAGSRALVIVSSLARGADTWRIEAEARGVALGQVGRPRLAVDGRRGPARLTVPPPPAPPAESTARPPAERVFHLLMRDGDVASASNYEPVRGILRAVGRRVQVYVDRDDAAVVAAAALGDIVATFDDRVYPTAARTIGTARDIDGDGRFTVFVSGRLTRLADGRHAVDGFVRGADLDRALPAPFSNQCDMMYLSGALAAGPHLRTVLAHEYTHAVAYSARPVGSAEEEGWLDEALAHLVEDQHGFSASNLDYRVSAFLSQPELYRLVVDDYYAADLFRSHGNRGATYLFLRWCVDRFGPGLVPALVASELRGVANLERATGRSFAELYRAWTVALFQSGFDPSVRPHDGYRSVDLRGSFGASSLAGPRTYGLVPGGGRMTWESRSTATRFLVVEASPGGAVEVEVRALAGARLQVTVVPLPADLPRLNLAASIAGDAADGPAALRMHVEESAGVPARVDAVSWEPLVPPAQLGSAAFRTARREAGSLLDPFPRRWLAGAGADASARLPGALGSFGAAPLVVKAVAVDARGRRVAAWHEVALPAEAVAVGRPPAEIGPASRN